MDKPDCAITTIAGYISTIRSHFEVAVGWKFIHSPLFLRTLTRLQQQIPAVEEEEKQKSYRCPATKELILAVLSDSALPLGVRTAIVVAYDALLRVSEYTSVSGTKFNALATLLCQDVMDRPEGVCIKLRHSKSDRWNQGAAVWCLPRDGDAGCPVAALREYMKAEPLARIAGQPFFIKRTARGSSYVSALDVNSALKKHAASVHLPVAYVSSHSLRVGGAFAMRNAGVSWPDIVTRGRWALKSGEAMSVLYARMSLERLRESGESRRVSGGQPGTFLAVASSEWRRVLYGLAGEG